MAVMTNNIPMAKMLLFHGARESPVCKYLDIKTVYGLVLGVRLKYLDIFSQASPDLICEYTEPLWETLGQVGVMV